MEKELYTAGSLKERSEKFAKDNRAKEVLLYLLGPKSFAAYRDHCKGVTPAVIAEKYNLSISSVYRVPIRAMSYIQSLSEVNRLIRSGASVTDIANVTFCKYSRAYKLSELVRYVNTGEDRIGVRKANAAQLKEIEIETSSKREKSERI